MYITDSIKYVGVNDYDVDLFEGQYVVPNGMAYNSYVVLDDKITVFDSVDRYFGNEWLDNISSVLDGRAPDYLVVQHMEPDHSANVLTFAKRYPNAIVVSSAKAFQMMKNYFGTDFDGRRLVVGEGDTLSTGAHTFRFVTAPMVHWPEVIMTYDQTDKVLFSADAFGKFGALDVVEEWACEARRYYFGIVGKYGVQVQNLLKKVGGLDISAVCPLHGPILNQNLSYYVSLYDKWSRYEAEEDGVFIAYCSIYGHTKRAVELLKEQLEKRNVKVSTSDLARSDWAENVEDAFKHSKLVLASPTYNGDVFPVMKSFIESLKERNYQNRTVAFVENGTWAPMSAKVMKGMLEGGKNLKFLEQSVKILSCMNAQNEQEITSLADELAK